MTAKEFILKDLELLEKVIVKNMNNIRTSVYNRVGADLRRRIFNSGKATDGSSIGKYKEKSKKIRQKKGRQINYVDLEMSGTLRQSIVTGTSDSRVVLGIQERNEPNGYSTVQNAIDQEDRFKDIFAPTEEEIKTGEKVFIKELDRYIKKEYAQKNKVTHVKPK